MGFFAAKDNARPQPGRVVSAGVLHRAECNACPLAGQEGLRHPKMEPTGAGRPLVYMLGEAPGATEDARGEQFVGKSGQLLRRLVPDEWADRVRWNNVVRCRPPGNATPDYASVECCRPSVERDIAASKPRAIFGFGNVPLAWATGQDRITGWRGRRVPVAVGGHACWFFPMLHPSYVSRMRGSWESGAEFVFGLDLRRAFDAVDGLPEPIVHDRERAQAGVECVTGRPGDSAAVCQFIDGLHGEKVVGFDIETNGLRPYAEGARILTVGLSGSGGSMAFPLYHREAEWSDRDREAVEARLRRFLYEAPCKKAVHHLAFELEWSAFFYGRGVARAAGWEDTISQAFILDERVGCLSLEFLGIQHFGINLKALSNVNRAKLDEEPLGDVLLYNGVDAKYHRLLYLEQARRLRADGLEATYREHLRRVPTMVLTQLKGLPVSRRAVEEFHRRYTDKAREIEGRIAEDDLAKRFRRRFRREFRPSANADVRDAVVQLIGQEIETVDEAALSRVKHPLAKLVLQFRKAKRVLSTYVLPLREGSPCLFPDGRIHPIISTVRTRTQRTSSDSPNIQNFPKRDDERREVRGQIRPRPGPRGARKVVSFDYGQIQARNVAMESGDPALVRAFWDEYDIHGAWMERVAELCPRWADAGRLASDKGYRKKKRHEAKNSFVFPSLFGAVPPTISKYLKVPVDVAERAQGEFWELFPDVRRWHGRLRALYEREGYVTGLTGFRRRAPISPNQLINSPIQSDEAAIVCDAMTRLSLAGEQASMEVHDDLTFIMYASEIDEKVPIITDAMLNCPFEWARVVPLTVEVSVGDDWCNLEEIGVFSSDKKT